MHLAQDNDVGPHIHAGLIRSAVRQKPFCQGRGWCGRLVPDAHGAQSARNDAAIDPVAIADEVVRSLIPGKCLRYLACNPFGRPDLFVDVDPDEVSAVEPDNDEGIEQIGNRWLEQRTGPWRQCPGAWCYAKKGSPSLVGWPPPL